MKEWRWNKLTPRQKQIALLAVKAPNMKMKYVGDQIGMTYRTLCFHLERIYGVLGVRDRIELAFEMGKHWKEIGGA